ncbi:hypothetical protein PHYSODRAFT_332150 [Phytophthora sojae]|uniref:MULE transposase domain-containing protein n=1 Tax=Phytophthora sojae (strain P6497) TaxID=1094619 RepID=G4ZCX1_PHYSP|nr:hypothetical protein PHYSODRAFT_332150 [Phytophthora sojae]EGZ18329.1 hypothetical protein PHYSODRAFT_332150 [Phytophthora sojae]|eukprot:XP_009527387.1 hypothetical protein PHYSODRAFT_332150 [Phytophthora sojae]
MDHGGYSFCVKRTCPETNTIYYSCKKFREGCKARLIVRGGAVVAEKSVHNCKDEPKPEVVDVRKEMRVELQRSSITKMSTPPAVLWQEVYDDLTLRYGGEGIALKIIPAKPAVSIIKHTRKDCSGGDVFEAILTQAVRCVSDMDARAFLQFSVVHPTAAGTGMQRLIGLTHPDLARMLRYPKITLFIDGTFAVVPKPFSQCLIVMAFEPSVDLYVPVCYVLVQVKSQETYWRVLNELVILSNRQLEPENVTCDFEPALVNAVLEQFPTANLVGCLFHWKQALRRKMLELRLPEDQIKDALSPGRLDTLTVIPEDQIAEKGVRYVRSIVDETGSKTKWNTFWKYFLKTWTQRFDVTTWNVHEMYPSLLTFIEGTKQEAARYLQRIDDIKKGLQTAPQHAPPVVPGIPAGYADFKYDSTVFRR